MSSQNTSQVTISQSVAILVDGNNMERSIHGKTSDTQTMLNFDPQTARQSWVEPAHLFPGG